VRAVKIAYAKIIGRSHIESNTVCQDSISISYRREVSCVSLSDGAGSCKHSDIGSKLTSKILCKAFSSKFDILFKLEDRESAQYLIDQIITALDSKGISLQCDISQLSATAMFVAIKNDTYIAGHIGDGVIGILHSNNLSVLSQPENGEFSNSTFFVTGNNAASHLRIYRGTIQSGDGFVLMSDGTAESLYDKQMQQLSVGCSTLFQWFFKTTEKKMNKILQSNLENLISKKTTDDCSIAIVSIA
jgi:serine/threonine protein phosphatase PrpC